MKMLDEDLEIRFDYFKEEYPDEYQEFKKHTLSWYDSTHGNLGTQIVAYTFDRIDIEIETKEAWNHFCVYIAKDGTYIDQQNFDCEEKAKAFALEAILKQKLKALI